MNDKIPSFNYLLTDKRARVYLLWMLLVTIGFVLTHYIQTKQINGFWALLSVIGLGYMAWVMPLKESKMKLILAAWFFPILIGMTVSGLAFRVDSLSGLIGYLGAFWLVVMAFGYLFNGLVDAPSKFYWFAFGLNLVLGLLCFFIEPFNIAQYLIASIVSFWSMSYLWLFRSEYQ